MSLQNVSSLGGQITSKSSSGECTFAASAPNENGNYTFSVDFYPSAGVKRVKTVIIRKIISSCLTGDRL